MAGKRKGADSTIRSNKDSARDTFGIRGTGATSHAGFGDPLTLEDYLFAVKREPGAYRTVFQVAHDIWAKWFKVVDMSEKPDEDYDNKVQKVLSDLNAQEVFTRATVFERLFGWSMIAITYVDYGKGIDKPVERPKEIRGLSAYSVLSADVQSTDEEKDPDSLRFGLPVLYTLSREGTAQAKLHFTRVIHLATRLLEHCYKGLSVLEPMYDDLTAFRNIRWGMGQAMIRIGHGLPDITIKNATKKKIDEFETRNPLRDLSAKSYIIHDEGTTVELKGAAGKALNPEPYVNSCIEQLSMASSMPAAIMRGAQAGALAGSDVNEREYFKFISDLQTSFEPSIWELIDRLIETGQIPEVEDYKIEWIGGFELNELDRTAAALNLAQTEQIYSNWLKVNELRARMDPPLDPLPGPEGDVIPGLLKKEQPVSQAAGEADSILTKLRKLFHGYKGDKK